MRQATTKRLIVVVILLIAAPLAGCSAEKQPPIEQAAPLADRSDAPPEPVVQPPAADVAEPAEGAIEAEAERSGTAATEPSGSRSLQDSLDNEPPPVDGDTMLAELGYVSPADRTRRALADPPGAARISQQSSLWVDVKAKRVFADGYVAQREAYLEMFACPAETKEHESIVGVVAQSSEVHAGLLAVGATQGTPVRFDDQYIPATGQRIRIWVMWYDEQGKFQHSDARRWIRRVGTDKSLELDWVFAGSSLWKDPSDGKEYYQADGGEMICLSNFSTALLDLPIESSDANDQLQFQAYTERIPPTGTPVRLMLVPIPTPSDQRGGEESAKPSAADPDQPPTAELMPLKQSASPTASLGQ